MHKMKFSERRSLFGTDNNNDVVLWNEQEFFFEIYKPVKI